MAGDNKTDWGSIGMAALPVVGNIANGILQGAQNKKNREAQILENQKSRDYNTDMWNKANEYNTPAAQMQRLKDAGVNPHLAYSNGAPMNTSNAAPSSSASSMPAGVAPHVDTNNLMQSMFMEKQMAQMDALTEKTRQETQNLATSQQGQQLINGIQKVTLDNAITNASLEIDIKKLSIVTGNTNNQLTEQSIKNKAQELTNLVSTNSEINQRISSIISSRHLTEAETAKVFQAIAVMKIQGENIKADTQLKGAQTTTQSAVYSNLRANTAYMNESIKRASRQNAIGEKYDYSNADNQYQQSSRNLNVTGLKEAQMVKQNMLLDVNIDAQDLQNMSNSINMIPNAVGNIISLGKNATPLKYETTTSGTKTPAGFKTVSHTKRNK